MRVDDDQQQTQAPPGAPASDDRPAPDDRPTDQTAAEDVNAEQPTQRSHPGWGPPEHYTPDGDRRDEPPGPVAIDEPGPAEATRTEEVPDVESPVVGVAQVPDSVPADAFWDKPTVDGYRDRWQEIQLRFIDDPRQAAEQAQALVSDVLDGFTAAVSRQRNALNRWQSAEVDDTEELRTTVRRYRDLLDRLLAL